MEIPSSNLSVRIGCRLAYETSAVTPVCVILKAQPDEAQRVVVESLFLGHEVSFNESQDPFGNLVCRTTLLPGSSEFRYDAIVEVPAITEDFEWREEFVPVDQVPSPYLRYTLPSRYVDSDKLMDFAWEHFGQTRNGIERVLAIREWVNHNIEYRFGAGRPDTSAYEIIQNGYGVCRDLAHVAIALCRTFNLPARYATAYLPDIGTIDPGTPMDFHAYYEVYLGKQWCAFDARFNVARMGRIKIAHGLDAVDAAFTTSYGQSRLTFFEVWAYQIRPDEVCIGDPIDLSKRLDGTIEVRH
ncbi:MAG: transglutaminase family protein [Verrucomicrobia bacterium]|nr:transglutaminase family protein [Verrucomicrobiota bacterium]MBV9674097.1 transglutaminase family protein [Verrucomicrobiota bacterium]